MTPLAYFRAFATEFAAVDDDTVNFWLGVATDLASVDCLSTERQNMAIALLAAHYLSMSQKQGSSGGFGPVTSEKEGDLSRSYGVTNRSQSVLSSTGYGQQYLDIASPCFGAGIMTRVG